MEGRWVTFRRSWGDRALTFVSIPRPSRCRWPLFSRPRVQRSSGCLDLGDSKILVLTRGRVVITVVLQTEEREILRDAISPSPVEMSDLALLHCRVSVQMKADRTSPATLR